MTVVSTILPAAFLLDIILGDPVYPFHPVRLIGHVISILEKILTTARLRNLTGGVLLLVSCQLVTLGIFLAGIAVISLFVSFPEWFFYLWCLYFVYSSLTVKDLSRHANRVRSALRMGDLDESRGAVQMLIGRDANRLDRHGVARAAVESMAENFVDGFLSPVFWFVVGYALATSMAVDSMVGGTAFILFYRVTNTLDSMVGYKNEKYKTFGTASARLDDILNWIPARLGIFFLTVATFINRFDVINAWKIGWRDRLKHSSPNAGHTEACVAGALGIKLNGPGIYPHGVVEKPWLGDGTPDLTENHIALTSRLIWTAAIIIMVLSTGLIILAG